MKLNTHLKTMKKIQQLSKGRAGIIGMVCLLAVLFSSCLKSHDDDVINQPAGLVSVINASPGSQSVDFYFNQNLVNTYPINYGNGIDYFRAYTGKRTATFNLAGTAQNVKSDTLTVQADKLYSIFLANVPGTPELVVLKDSIARPAAGMATIRFVNLGPDAPAADLAIKGGAVLASNKSYKGFSGFVPVQGNSTYTLEIRQTGTSTVLASLTGVTLNSGSVYTVWLQGLSAATDNTKLSANIQTNAYY